MVHSLLDPLNNDPEHYFLKKEVRTRKYNLIIESLRFTEKIKGTRIYGLTNPKQPRNTLSFLLDTRLIQLYLGVIDHGYNILLAFPKMIFENCFILQAIPYYFKRQNVKYDSHNNKFYHVNIRKTKLRELISCVRVISYFSNKI